MDKVKLYRDIARLKKQIFAVVSLLGFLSVVVATLIGHGSDFYVLFRNSIIGLIVFGFLAYLLGVIYEKIVEEPLIDSYREEARKRIEELKNMGDQSMAMKINVGELSPGMRVIEPVYSKEGALLVRGGESLTERKITILKENNIPQIKVEAKRSIPSDIELDE